ncbi:Concanavalin A-like lectin/glucanase, subgroup [Cynara cardunculus var. scolymus]|uniref:Concanavalin A-like lectin/glucanase, subgroup n=1 Tax=Cynara cardunculus var. scolymus TaxID=59895 RepID=A0A103XVG2_CYNCS|nr:Concanavalin A-like lectin/glucanase, subgroup [Cynara cardunculus var. scolymus]
MAASPPSQLHPTLSILLLLLLLLRLSLLHATPAPPNNHPDLAPLLSFKSSADVSNKLSSWNNSSDPCNNSSTFYGVSCLHNRVTSLVLEGLDLQGRFDSLASLVKLRLLSLKRNRLVGPIPDLSNLTSLRLVFLSYNQISGEFPTSLPSLFRLDLSYNNISGDIPPSLNRLTQLLTLRLEENQFSGAIQFLNLPNLRDLNMSTNNISGEIPASLSGFPESVFSNNPVLCGFPLPKCTRPEIPSPVVSSSPTSLPSTAAVPDKRKSGNHHGGGKINTVVVVAIIIGDVLVLGLVSLLLYCYFCENSARKSINEKTEVLQEGKRVYTPTPATANSSFEKGRMVFFDGTRRFELEDLLRASAEMLGKGGLGTAYKAVLDDGNVVAVKRLKEVIGGKREFESQMEVLGRLRHPNVVSLKAYYFAKDEKLLVYDYMTNGNLFWLLHASGAGRGLAFIHTSGNTLKLTHGNIKSTNILIDKSGNACVSDIGLSAFTPTTASTRSIGYRAPELSSATNRKSTQKSDIYSFGILLLELLTGKCPSIMDDGGVVDLPRWVQSVVREEWTAEVFDLELMSFKDIEEEMVGLLHIALSCTSVAPDQRPEMGHVVKMIHDIEGVDISPSHDMPDSTSNSPSVIGA